MIFSQNDHKGFKSLHTFYSKQSFYNETSLLRDDSVSSQAVVHLIISAPPLTNAPSCLVWHIYRTRHLHILQNAYYWQSMVPLTLIVNNSSTPETRRPPFSLLPLETKTILFLLSVEDANLSVVSTLWTLLSYSTGSWMNLSWNHNLVSSEYTLSSSIRISHSLSATPFMKHFYPIPRLPRGQVQNIFMGQILKISANPDAKLAVKILRTYTLVL